MISELDFTYCPNCAGHLKKKDTNVLICQMCDLHYYINPKACNAIILYNSKKQIVMVKRKNEPQKGMWDLPGGFIDINETIEESVIREVKEELSINITSFVYFSSFYEMYKHGGINAYTICSVFFGKLPENSNIVASDDAEEVTFFNTDEIPYNSFAFDGMKKVVKDFIEQKLTQK